jgi:hypothetical protein
MRSPMGNPANRGGFANLQTQPLSRSAPTHCFNADRRRKRNAQSSGEPALSFCPEKGAKVRGSVSVPAFSDFHTIR